MTLRPRGRKTSAWFVGSDVPVCIELEIAHQQLSKGVAAVIQRSSNACPTPSKCRELDKVRQRVRDHF